MRDSFRARIIAVVLLVGVAPMGILGYWLTRSAQRSGEALLRARLTDALTETEKEIGTAWVQRRSALLDLADAEEIVSALAGRARLPASVVPHEPQSFARVAVITSLNDTLDVWRASGQLDYSDPLHVSLELYDPVSGTRTGRLIADVRMSALLPRAVNVPGAAGVVLGAFDAEATGPLLPLPFDPQLMLRERFEWGGEPWIAMQSRLTEPAAVLAVAAPVAPFTAPFRSAGRRGVLLLALVAGAGVLLTILATRGLTRSLEGLATAAVHVSAGDLDQRINEHGPQEVARVAHAFNTMTDNLRRTLGELADHRAQAAAGEFAMSLAHEVRNPLTAIRIDLQVVEEQLPDDSPARDVQRRALDEVVRLDATVSDALAAARAHGLGARTLDLRGPVRAAIRAAAPTFKASGVAVPSPALEAMVPVRGEPGALEQVFLNLLLNAAQAVEPGGSVSVSVSAADDQVRVTVADDGPGIPDDIGHRIFQSFFSTKDGGTGLGLAIAQRIVRAHGGTIDVASAEDGGTRAVVSLPPARAGS